MKNLSNTNLLPNISKFLSLNLCPNCNSPIIYNAKCSCNLFCIFNKMPSLAFYSNNDSFLVTKSRIVSYYDYNDFTIHPIHQIIEQQFYSHNPNLSLIFNALNKLNTFL